MGEEMNVGVVVAEVGFDLTVHLEYLHPSSHHSPTLLRVQLPADSLLNCIAPSLFRHSEEVRRENFRLGKPLIDQFGMAVCCE